ncbi:MAG: lysylphosphatidylglycerol synthase transmembrane domain-containing protein [Myxococcota bacterium]
MRTRWLSWIGLLVSAAAIVILVRSFDVGAAMAALGRADPWWLLAAAIAYTLLFPLRGLRWSRLMAPVKAISVESASLVFAVGFMANNVMPARLGDVARALVLARREGLSTSTTLANIGLERVFDGLTVVGILLGVLTLAPPGAAWVEDVAWAMGGLFIVAVAFAAFLARAEGPALRILRALLSPFPRALSEAVLGIATRLGHGLHVLRSGRQTLEVLGLSLLVWSLEISVYVLVGKAFGLGVPAHGMALVMCVLTLGLTAPSAPAFVGVFEGLVVAAIGVYGVGDPLAPAFAVAMHIIHFLPGTLLGAVASWRLGLKVKELRGAAPLARSLSSSS